MLLFAVEIAGVGVKLRLAFRAGSGRGGGLSASKGVEA
jgi:hypothetical protein